VTPQLTTWVLTLIFVPLIGLALYRRVKTTFGRQPVRPIRMLVRMVLLIALAIVLLAGSPPSTAGAAGAVAGLAVGLGLAVVGLRFTKFETTPQGRFYVPNGWFGLGVTAIFLGRLAARLAETSGRLAAVQDGRTPANTMQSSPLTLAVFFLLAGYYVTTYAGVLWKERAMAAPDEPR
jgi:hypothetical protein